MYPLSRKVKSANFKVSKIDCTLTCENEIIIYQKFELLFVKGEMTNKTNHQPLKNRKTLKKLFILTIQKQIKNKPKLFVTIHVISVDIIKKRKQTKNTAFEQIFI